MSFLNLEHLICYQMASEQLDFKIEIKDTVGMIIKRWLAPIVPNKKQIQSFFDKEGLQHIEERFEPGTKIKDHRHPFDEVRMIVEGKLFYNVDGNKLLVKAGDRIVIPANTRHSKEVQGDKDCLSICAYQAY